MRVLIADDDRRVCDLLAEYVRVCGHEVVATVTKGGLEVIRSFSILEPDLVLLDVFMPRCNGLTVCHALLSRTPSARVVLMSGISEENHPFVMASKASGFLNKPLRLEEVRHVLAARSVTEATETTEPDRQVA